MFKKCDKCKTEWYSDKECPTCKKTDIKETFRLLKANYDFSRYFETNKVNK